MAVNLIDSADIEITQTGENIQLSTTVDMQTLESNVSTNTSNISKNATDIENLQTYSTSEVNTGKVWIDGKPIYRKVFNIGTLPNSTEKIYTTDLNWATHTVVKIDGCAISSSGVMLPINFSNPISAAQMIGCRTTGTNTITVYTGIDRTNLTGYVILEYTKTTD